MPLPHCVSCGVTGYGMAATPPLLSVKMADRSPTTDLERQKKLASEAYRAIRGVARNSIANRAMVGDQV